MGGVVFLRSQIPNADSRLQRYVDIIKEKNIPYLITAWNRENKKIEREKYYFIQQESSYWRGHFKYIFINFVESIFISYIVEK